LHESKIDVDEAWSRLKDICSSLLGIERDSSGLQRVPAELEEFARLPLSANRAVLELRSGARAARLVARAAFLRTESRGVHHRSDFSDPEPAWAGVRLRLARN
jgi:L-aspartate oxidase